MNLQTIETICQPIVDQQAKLIQPKYIAVAKLGSSKHLTNFYVYRFYTVENLCWGFTAPSIDQGRLFVASYGHACTVMSTQPNINIYPVLQHRHAPTDDTLVLCYDLYKTVNVYSVSVGDWSDKYDAYNRAMKGLV